MKLVSLLTVLFLKILHTQCTHVRGTWNTNDFFVVLMKFGFAKTDPHDSSLTGYVYGNITTSSARLNKSARLVLIDSDRFIRYYRIYRYRVLESKEKACQQMFAELDSGSSSPANSVSKIPCGINQICTNATDHVLGSQYTFRIDELQSPQ